MSATFWVPEAPKHTIACTSCAIGRRDRSEGYPLDAYAYVERDGEVFCKPWHGGECDGTEEASVAPECNFHNTGTVALLRSLELDPERVECWGHFDVAELSDIRRRILWALNVSAARERAGMVSEGVETGGPGTGQARMIEAPQTDERACERLQELGKVVAWADEHKLAVSWG